MSEELTRPVDDALLSAAFALAASVHRAQKRKGPGEVPYLAHLMGVAALAMEHGATDVEAAAALLHDAVEDGGGAMVADRIRVFCGHDVARIVLECSDSDVDTTGGAIKASWHERKRHYIEGLEHASAGALLVSACDKLHNLTATVVDLTAPELDRARVWSRFKTGWQGQRWYYSELLERYRAFGDERVQRVATRLHAQLGLLDQVIASDGHDPTTSGPPFVERPVAS